ncbi:IstA-like integrase of IS21 family [Agrobacterium tumefaciens]|nr:IstA-like integrase of IS21 family [Agrobacterium tumefaciens]
MLIVETILKIRRLAHVQGKTIKAICRELGISRKVVRKVLRSDETEFKYERTRQPQPKLGPGAISSMECCSPMRPNPLANG